MPRTITVSTSKDLYNALASCKGGETILLEEGSYGKLSLTMKSGFDYDFPKTVTIASADPDNPAIFTSADVRDAENMAFDGIKFDYTFKAGDSIYTRPFIFERCEGLTIRNSTFDGDVATSAWSGANGFGAGTGLFVRSSRDVTLEANEFYGFQRGVYMDSNAETTIRGNDVHSMRMDGMCFGNMDNLLIEDNYIHDFRGSPTSGDHSDFIQFWTASTSSPSTNVTIRDNVLDIGNGTWTQSIFMRNEEVDWGRAGTEMYYRNVLIENNTITNAHKNGINVGQSTELTIRNNTLLHADGGKPDGADSGVEIPTITVSSSSTRVTVANNLVSDLSGVSSRSGWSVVNNVVVQDQDPFRSNHYSEVFVASTLQAVDGRHEFIALEGSIIDERGVGSLMTRFAPAGLVALFHVEDKDVATRVFDASMSTLNGVPLPAGTIYTWAFDDGTTAKGMKISHTFSDGGHHGVTLSVRLPDGKTDSSAFAFSIQRPEILELGTGGFVAYHGNDPIALAPIAAITAEGLQLGAKGVAASVSRTHVVDMVGSDSMTIAFSLDADRAGTSGELFRLHGSFNASVTSAGELQFRLMQQDGPEVRVTTKGAALNAGPERDVVVSLNDGKLEIWVDGALKGSAAATGTVGGATGYGTHGLSFGNPWGNANFNGDLKAFAISVSSGDFPAKPHSTVIDAGPQLEARIGEEMILELGSSNFVAYDDDDATLLAPLSKMTDDGLQLGAKGATASVARKHVSDLIGSDDMTIAFSLDADKVGTTGELFRLHGSFIASVDNKGELVFRLSQEGMPEAKVVTKGAGLNAGAERDVVISLEDGKLGVWVEGTLKGSVDAPGVVGGAKGFASHQLTFGNPWNKTNFNGDLKAFEISVGNGEASDVPLATSLTQIIASTMIDDEVLAISSAKEWADRFEFLGAAEWGTFAA